MPTPADSLAATTAHDHRAAAPARAVRADAPPARTLLWQAALLGVSGDALLRDGPVGPGLAIWIGVLALAVLSLTWSAGRRVPRESAIWLGVAGVLGALTASRASEALRAFDVLFAIAALGLAAIALRDRTLALHAERLRDTLWAGAAIVRNTARGIVPLALRELFATDHRRTDLASRIRLGARLTIIAGTLLLVFGSLLRSADPIFARLVRLPDLDVETLVSHLFVAGFFAWIAGGWAYGALVESPAKGRAPLGLPFTLRSLDVTTALGTLAALFSAYVLTQLGWFFGGERFLHATTGLTAAEYARQGFFQMVWVVALVVPVLLVTRAALAPETALTRRHTLLSLPIVGLLGAIILSAALRMRLYVDYYGLTTERLYTLVIMGWLAIVLILLATTVLRGRGRPFVAGSVATALMLLAGLHVVVPDVLVARVNLARAERATSELAPALDLRHLATLSGDAAPLAVRATLDAPLAPPAGATADAWNDQRCDAASSLLERWGPASHVVRARSEAGAWRTWNAGETAAVRAVGARSAALRGVVHDACARVRAARRAAPYR
ncbi:MAG TPA: DUF4173 domain-containing protein [Gemmatimonadaceae bacterium]|jgi:hypothetical protein|nr:DUF4173 domain-containing protein [Gemmatimonadaceae bacterium]